jgi:hypothetical protein
MSELTVCGIPQWQGSSSPMALRLREGTRLLTSLTPGGHVLWPRLVSSPGTTVEGVRHADALAAKLSWFWPRHTAGEDRICGTTTRGSAIAALPLVAHLCCGDLSLAARRQWRSR